MLDALQDRVGIVLRTPDPISIEALERVHDPAYVEALIASSGTPRILDPDTRTSEGSVEAALLAAGAARQAALEAARGPWPTFAVVRPPGHHAGEATAMGFCLFNNVVVAAQAVRAELGLERILIVDWDVHHGNGTEDLVRGREEILFFSVHQGGGGFYPGTGLVSGGNVLNVPLPAGAGDPQLQAALREVLRPAADAFQPELVLVSAGFDAHRDDPLAQLQATPGGFAELASGVLSIARQHCEGRLCLVLEGGYDLDALGDCAVAVAEALGG